MTTGLLKSVDKGVDGRRNRQLLAFLHEVADVGQVIGVCQGLLTESLVDLNHPAETQEVFRNHFNLGVSRLVKDFVRVEVVEK